MIGYAESIVMWNHMPQILYVRHECPAKVASPKYSNAFIAGLTLMVVVTVAMVYLFNK